MQQSRYAMDSQSLFCESQLSSDEECERLSGEYESKKLTMKKQGDLILEEKPFAHILSMKLHGHRCDSCFQSCSKLRKCSVCGVLWYCSTECQRYDWPLHKLECACLVGVAPDIPVDSVRLMLRILIRNKCNETEPSFKTKPGWRPFSHLESHCDEIRRDIGRCEQFSKILFTIKKLVGDAWTLPADGQILDVFGKMVINTFTVMDKDLSPIGAGLYLGASLFDHSCQPNTVVTFNGCTLQARASCDIKDTAPSEYRISYIDLLSSASQRQTELQKLYYFTCSCSRCSLQQLDGLMLSSLCPIAGCNGHVTQSTDGVLASCENCGWSDFSEDYAERVHEMNSTLEAMVNKLESLRENAAYEEVLTSCKKCLQRQQQVCHPGNVYIIKCHDLAFDAAINMELWDTAIQYGLLTIERFILYYGEYHPRVSLQLLKLGKLEHYQQHLVAAQKHLQQAHDILRVTHGASHDLYQESLHLLNDCEAEMKYRHSALK